MRTTAPHVAPVVEKGVTTALPDPALVVLVGASGSGKSAWAQARYRPQEVVSSDQLRGVVGSGEHDLDASADAFALLDQIVAARLKRGLNTVVDTLGLDPARRRAQLEAARQAGLPAVAMLFDTDPALCRRRNAQRDRSVPAAVLDGQLRRVPAVASELDAEGWDLVTRPGEAAIEPAHSPGSRRAAAEQDLRPARLGFVLQISRFGWQDDPPGWLAAVAGAAADAGLDGIALMDHLIQIPQVGRAWEPILEPWVTLGLLAGLAPGLRLGTLVTPVTFRSPGILAKAVATLDVLTAGRDPAEAAVTVLDIPVIGDDRGHAAALVEKLRGRTPAAAFARQHHAGIATDHIGRYRLLAERGVSTVFVSLPDLAGPQDVLRLIPVTAAFR
jgi:predicted kinase